MNQRDLSFVDLNKFVETNLLEKNCSYFQCHICYKRFAVKEELQRHTSENCGLLNQDSTAKYPKDELQRYPSENCGLLNQESPAKYQVLKCSTCSGTFESNRTFTKHFSCHETYNNQTSSFDVNQAKDFQCSYCVKSYKHRTNLITHEKSHFPASHSCPLCDQKFKLKHQLKSHHDLRHTDARPFSCDQCGKRFKLKQQLQCHLLTHEDYRPFPCDKCGKSFKLKQQLQNHSATHIDLKPFQCSVCQKCFRLKPQLNVHFRVHTKIKPYECFACGKTFSLKQNMNVHFLKHTENKPFQCDECGKGFITKQNLTVHAKVHKKS